jgi:nicotinamide riboside kinase
VKYPNRFCAQLRKVLKGYLETFRTLITFFETGFINEKSFLEISLGRSRPFLKEDLETLRTVASLHQEDFGNSFMALALPS